MLLGKRGRPPMRRTTSLSEIVFDVNAMEPTQNSDFLNSGYNQQNCIPDLKSEARLSMLSPRNPRRYSGDFTETSQFLRVCSLCNRRLVPGKDIYMYRGDSAYCSLECRQQVINREERKEKCGATSMKKENPVSKVTMTENISSKDDYISYKSFLEEFIC